MRPNLAPIILLSLLISGCTRSWSGRESSAIPGARVFAVRGVVREVAVDRREVTICHDAIAGYMPAMTMPFSVPEPSELAGVMPGDKVAFRLVVTGDSHWIDTIRRVGVAARPVNPQRAPSVPQVSVRPILLKPGDLVPDFELLDETGRAIRFSDFRGRVLAFTFIFTRCPLPNFCPRMSTQFARARSLLQARTNAAAQFLSISFDPEFDTPAVLARHARLYRGADTNGWLFASAGNAVISDLGSRLGLEIDRSGSGISHNLRTVVLDAKGRIYRQFTGNEWTPEELVETLLSAATLSANH